LKINILFVKVIPMKSMEKPLRCKLGWHSWEVGDDDFMVCKLCGKRESERFGRGGGGGTNVGM